MAKSLIEYDLLISCPGDVVEEIRAVNRAIKKFNDQYSDVLGLRVNPKHWSKDSYNQSGGKAQALLNKQLVNKCDAAVAIFWTRFGTPTDKYGSGTEEEIEELIGAGKQVFMYFSSKPVAPEHMLDTDMREQYEKIKAFRQKYEDEGKGIYSTYTSTKEFQDKFFAHLSQHFLTVKKIEELSVVKKSKLSIKAIDDNSICDTIIRFPFSISGRKSTAEMRSEIEGLFEKIERYQIVDVYYIQPVTPLVKKVEVRDENKQIISMFAEKYDILLSDGFFKLGALTEDLTQPAVLTGGRTLIGKTEEKNKYNDILKLKDRIIDFLGWSQFEISFENLFCIKLAVTNEGNTFDEDIEVTLCFPAGTIILPENLPVPEELVLEHIINEGSLEDIFAIPGTSKYNDYQSSIKAYSRPYVHTSAPQLYSGLMGNGRDYEKEYKDDLYDVFDYDFFNDNGDIIVKLHIDYLKHNTTIAFPTVLFITADLRQIQYSITAKHNDTVIEGVIKAGDSQ